MGTCQSCEATVVLPTAPPPATAKLVLDDGKLEEFAKAVRVSHVLQKSPACFVCNADDMELGDFLSAVGAGEELQPGQLYFLLPRSMLRRRLQPEDMASLAVRASSALVNSCRYPAWLPHPDPVAVTASSTEDVGRHRRRRGHRGRSSASSLSSIPEWESELEEM